MTHEKEKYWWRPLTVSYVSYIRELKDLLSPKHRVLTRSPSPRHIVAKYMLNNTAKYRAKNHTEALSINKIL